MTAVRQWIAHGTLSGYQMHIRRGEQTCDDCKAARAAYMRERRREGRDVKQARLRSVRWRAIERLIAEHNDRFKELLAEETG